MTWFEIVRWLRWNNAASQLTAFEQARHQLTIHPVTPEILDRAADLWAMAASRGKPKADADLIFAATALEYGLELVTGKQSHFGWIPLLTLKDCQNEV